MSKTVITSDKAPAAIGTYSQAIKAGNTVYMSGQIPLDPVSMELVEGFEAAAKVCPPAITIPSDSRAFCQQSHVSIMQTVFTLFARGGPKKAKKTTAKASANL